MADKIIGINLNGVDYDYTDEETSEVASNLAESIGDLSNLETEEKGSIVGAINEIASGAGGGGVPLGRAHIDITQFFTVTDHLDLSIGDPPQLYFYNDGTIAVVVNGEYFSAPSTWARNDIMDFAPSDLAGLFSAIKDFMGDKYEDLVGSRIYQYRGAVINGNSSSASIRTLDFYQQWIFAETSINPGTLRVYMTETAIFGGGNPTIAYSGIHKAWQV